MRLALTLLIIVFVVDGCASSKPKPIDLSLVAARLDISSDRKVAVGVYDARPYVVSGKKTPAYFGELPNLFVGKFDLNMRGQSLAQALSTQIVDAMLEAEIQASAKALPHSVDETVARKLLGRVKADRYLMVTLKDYQVIGERVWSTGWNKTVRNYDVLLRVFDNQRKTLARRYFKGQDKISDGTKRTKPETGRRIFLDWLRRLFDDDEVRSALR